MKQGRKPTRKEKIFLSQLPMFRVDPEGIRSVRVLQRTSDVLTIVIAGTPPCNEPIKVNISVNGPTNYNQILGR